MTTTTERGRAALAFGSVTLERVPEYFGTVHIPPQQFFPEVSQETWRDNEDWFAPDFLDPDSGTVRSALQTWVLRSGGRTILVDTGAGNGKERPYAQVWAHRRTAYLDHLAAVGVRPEDVDIVVNTHLHNDHVGWNTVLEGREWVPTFPNARYLMPARDFEYWNPVHRRVAAGGPHNQNVFEDSVAPVHRAGLVELWEDEHVIDEHLRLVLAPGHTPGSSAVLLDSGGTKAMFVGDMLHTPAQVLEPHANSCFCEDPEQARATRRELLARAADEDALVFPAHFGGAGGFRVRACGDGFALAEWAPFAAPELTED
ncbi:glyoxylase-like metal-dependent hydrolase (beta-lactamase superfamily II) [Saccharothrix coeruleofusca]|uniref:MBL fold metallo-hydrolase n=1 Tax=Saccharothrix coeruleofusca TaxID=33919 RepID=UPI001AE8C76B|nr:MBL fold metallo-hydrolase [Saccharothrix coeruleofusca]MBP2338843.1 glyoxylase-like metal-dependent hydrolase (beta-lactamase superfamily II) [Saccharothrix coeruleofusca]